MAEAGWGLSADPWLGAVLGRDVYALALDEGFRDVDASASLAEALGSRPGFTYTRVRTGNVADVRFLQAAGLRIVDTSVVLEKAIDPHGGLEPETRVAVPADRAAVRRIAREGFRFSRFHLDPTIPNELANQVKEQWVESYVAGRRGDTLVVRTVDGDGAGFLALLVDRAENTLVIDLIAVDSRHRQRGLAADMIRFGESRFPGIPRVRVCTQIANVPSLRLYAKLGFRLVDSSYVFHHHSPVQ